MVSSERKERRMQNDEPDIFVDPIIQFDYEEPERRLYLAVIGRALLDIIRDPSKNAQTYREDVIIKDRATAWFFCSIGVTCDNFEFICEGAGIDPSVVRSFAYTVIHSEDKKVHIYSIYNSSKE